MFCGTRDWKQKNVHETIRYKGVTTQISQSAVFRQDIKNTED